MFIIYADTNIVKTLAFAPKRFQKIKYKKYVLFIFKYQFYLNIWL